MTTVKSTASAAKACSMALTLMPYALRGAVTSSVAKSARRSR